MKYLFYPVLTIFIILFFINDINAKENISLKLTKDQFVKYQGDLVIKDIRIIGLKRTKKSVVINKLNVKPGNNISMFNESEFIQQMHKLRIFKEISVDYLKEGDKVIIRIDLKDKWSLIPVPVISVSGGVKTFGLFLIETNLFGYNKKMFVGGSYSIPKGWGVMLGYVDPSIAGTNFKGVVTTNYRDKIFENCTMDHHRIQRYRASAVLINLNAGYEFNFGFTPYILGKYSRHEVVEGFKNKIDSPDSASSCDIGIRLKYELLRYTRFFKIGFSTKIDYLHSFPVEFDGRQFDQVKFDTKYSFTPYAEHIASIRISGGVGDTPTVHETRISGKPCFRVLPPKLIAADYYVGGAIEYEIPNFITRMLTISTLVFWESGVYKKDNGPLNLFYGPGGGIRVYLNDITIPAIGFDIAYNIETKYCEFTFSVGKAME